MLFKPIFVFLFLQCKKSISIQLEYLELLMMIFYFYLKFVYIVEDFHPSITSKNKSFKIKSGNVVFLTKAAYFCKKALNSCVNSLCRVYKKQEKIKKSDVIVFKL